MQKITFIVQGAKKYSLEKEEKNNKMQRICLEGTKIKDGEDWNGFQSTKDNISQAVL